MPKVMPIRALRYPAAGGADISACIAPPYDVLDEGPKQALLKKDARNVVAVDLPVTPPKTVGPDQAYEEAGRLFRQWVDQGVLVRDEKPAFYAYEQSWDSDGLRRRRRGLFAAVGVEEFGRAGGGIHRHEKTIRSGTDDRLKLMEATEAQMSPVFSVYDDPKGRIAALTEAVYQRPADVTARTDHDQVDHALWVIENTQTIEAVADAFAERDLFIADGHHRYTTALNYSKAHPDKPLASTCLMVVVAQQDPGMIVLPTHRVLTGLVDFSMDRLGQILASGPFELTATDHGREGLETLAESLPSSGPHAIGLYDPSSKKTYRLQCAEQDPGADIFSDRPEVWRRLDVVVFHEWLVDRLLRPSFGGEAIAYKYPHKVEEVVSLAEAEPDRLGVLMQATPLESVIGVSLAGDVMPPKSTFFFPKLATGLVISPMV
ncbi:MAG: DUF1015 domain-containing protein [Phycisphaeraceae bacterium]|nr:DUF1015 domain-containing protein [Phycisphaeraceae bacterium]